MVDNCPIIEFSFSTVIYNLKTLRQDDAYMRQWIGSS